VTVIEQNHGQDRGGTGLGVDRELLSAVTGVDATKSTKVKELPVVRTHREVSTWHAIAGWLRAVADATRSIAFSLASLKRLSRGGRGLGKRFE
jgi:hypothetical protein